MKYLKHTSAEDENLISYNPEGTNTYIPHHPANKDFAAMIEEVDAGTSTIEEVDD
jgi:hypothetical protein